MNTTQQTILIQYTTNMSFRMTYLPFRVVLSEYQKCCIPRHLTVNQDGRIPTGPGYLIWDLWVGNLKLAHKYCEKRQETDKKIIWALLSKCWTYAYERGGGKCREVEQFRQSITVE